MSDRPFDQHDTSQSTRDVAMEEGRRVGQDAKDSARSVAETAGAEVQNVAGEARSQVASLYQQVRSDVTDQASNQQQRAAGGLHSLAGELNQMAEGQDESMATGLARQAAERLDGVAGWLENREPADLLDDLRRYARRNPGTFLAAAAVLGFVGGRLTRGLRDDASDAGSQGYGQSARAYGGSYGGTYGGTDLPMTTSTYGTSGVYDAAGGGYGGRPGPAAETYTATGAAVTTPGYDEPVLTSGDETGVPSTDAQYDEDIRAINEDEQVYPTTADAGHLDGGGERR